MPRSCNGKINANNIGRGAKNIAVSNFPIFVDVESRHPLLFGGGALAAAKARVLALRAPIVTVAADRLDTEFAPLLMGKKIEKVPFEQKPRELLALIKGRPLVIAASGCANTDEKISDIARSLGVPVNVPDRPDICTFHLPAIVDRDPVTIAIATDGAAPVLAQRLRAQIEDALHPRLGQIAQFAHSMREKVTAFLPTPQQRRAFWADFFAGDAARAIENGNDTLARRITGDALAETGRSQTIPPRVYLVGAGPGDPELLTLKAVRLLREADAIVYDDLVGPEILKLARREARLIYAGKRGGQPSTAQIDIHKTIIELAKPGTTIVRLKGGDPFIFGRGGEEVSALCNAGLSVEVVPGISAALAGAARNLIPLTDRRFASAVTFLTGHSAGDGRVDFGGIDLGALYAGRHTLAIYMGVRNASSISAALTEAGWPVGQDVVIAENVSRANERLVRTTLRDLQKNFQWLGIKGPAILFIGACASFAAQQQLSGASYEYKLERTPQTSMAL